MRLHRPANVSWSKMVLGYGEKLGVAIDSFVVGLLLPQAEVRDVAVPGANDKKRSGSQTYQLFLFTLPGFVDQLHSCYAKCICKLVVQEHRYWYNDDAGFVLRSRPLPGSTLDDLHLAFYYQRLVNTLATKILNVHL